MKKLLIIFLFLISTITVKVNALTETVQFKETNEYSISSINGIIPIKENYIINEATTDTNLYSYNTNHELIATKKIASLTNSVIVNFKDNIFLAGIKSNTLSIYLLDTNLRIIKSFDTSYIINSSNTINPYLYNNKIYLSITKDNLLASNNIYEIDESLNIKESPFSSYESIKDILRESYYLIKYNDISYTYNSGTTLNNTYILVGSKKEGEAEESIISFYDDTNLLNTISNPKYLNYQKVLIIKDTISILAQDRDNNSYLIFLNNDGTVLSEHKLDYPFTDMFQLGDKLLLVLTNTTTTIVTYKYNLEISHNNLPYGTIKINPTAEYNENVSIDITANSGYDIDTITINDAHGKIIPLNNNTFTMPDTNVYVNVTYKETIANPNTADYILISIIILTISVFGIRYFYKKYKWLK